MKANINDAIAFLHALVSWLDGDLEAYCWLQQMFLVCTSLASIAARSSARSLEKLRLGSGASQVIGEDKEKKKVSRYINEESLMS
jgi:ABC-type Fe3+-siderophore transport system permease subunit